MVVRAIGNRLYLAPLEKEKVHKILDVGTGTGIFAKTQQILGNDLSAIQPSCHLNPGGWAEFQDMDVQYYSDDGTYTEDHQTRKWNKDLVRACEMIGRTGRPGPQLKGWITDAGFQQVTHQRFKCPMGPWPKDPHYKEVGMLNLIQLLDGLEGFSLKLCCDVLGQSREEVLARLKTVRKELKDPSMHAIFDHHVVYGQKPKST
ncbi:Secondary metabolism regulator LAE1 [Colletotrichum sp. SAR 10_75]|nr:Secondary metabolism regulator LAE1 [Colletotrichum sp. SAR 10_75]